MLGFPTKFALILKKTNQTKQNQNLTGSAALAVVPSVRASPSVGTKKHKYLPKNQNQ